MISKLEAQWLPIGFVSGLQMNAKDKLLGFSEDKTQAFVVGVMENSMLFKLE